VGTPEDTIRVGRRYNGPPHSANGGYISGLLAPHARRMLDSAGDVVVQLHAPPPLDTDLRLTRAGRRVHVWHDDVIVATASHQAPGAATVAAVATDLAERAMRRYEGHGAHPFPTCFVCGPEHPDGLRLAPGPVPDPAPSPTPDTTPDPIPGDHVACVWTPDAAADDGTGTGTVAGELVWAALDCPGGWTLDPLRSPLLLGRMTARITALPRVGETVVAVGRGTPGEGRVRTCATALFRRDGTELARSTATWVRLAPTTSLQDTKAAIS
jgi:hypothetical protein